MALLSSTRLVALALSVAAASAATFAPRVAAACGGCFAPPIGNTVVSYHRMVLSVSTKETTLYDQIRYSGSPDSFAWVLPIRGEAKVGLSSDVAFAALDQTTQTSIIPPPTNCPAPPTNCAQERGLLPPQANAGASADASGVTVLKQETVGPYETVQLSAKSPTALSDWLKGHGYNIPADIQPLIESYVKEGFDFLALKLVPGQGVSSMRPVRVTTPGAGPSLPLRMVAAGSGASVGVTLWVLGEGRWEPQSFPSFVVKAEEITWKWAQSRSDYDTVRKEKLDALGGSAWEIESSARFATTIVPNLITQQANFRGGRFVPQADGGAPTSEYDQFYDPVYENGTLKKSGRLVFEEDMATMFQNGTLSRITRLRSDLPRVSLATDLVLQASADQGEIATFRKITKEEGEPNCPVYDGCKYVGAAPRSKAQAEAQDQCGSSGAFCSSGGGCSLHARADEARFGALGALGLGLVAFAARRRRR